MTTPNQLSKNDNGYDNRASERYDDLDSQLIVA